MVRETAVIGDIVALKVEDAVFKEERITVLGGDGIVTAIHPEELDRGIQTFERVVVDHEEGQGSQLRA
jgi:NifB/MoaA-like Fe-S oxidoreductase